MSASVCVIKLTVDLQHNGGLLSVTTDIGGLAAVDTRIFDDGIINNELGSGCFCVERHSLRGHDALALGVIPLQLDRIADS